MINRTPTITFTADSVSFSHAMTSVIYGIELTGESIHLFDWDVQNIELNGRMVWTMTARVDADESDDFIDFITADNKELTIDNFDYAVVNDPQNYKTDFKLWQKYAGYAEIVLRFKRRSLGVDISEDVYSVLETQSGVLVETDDGLLIEIH
jgi:hypothetical protein